LNVKLDWERRVPAWKDVDTTARLGIDGIFGFAGSGKTETIAVATTGPSENPNIAIAMVDGSAPTLHPRQTITSRTM